MANFITNIFNKFTKEDKDFSVEGATEQKELLKYSMSDEEMLKEINSDIGSATPLYTMMKEIQEENEKYYLGEQLDKKRFTWELPTAENLLYMATETIISIITSNRKDPIVLSARDTEESKVLAKKTQQYLTWKWNYEDMMTKFEDWVRQASISRIGVLKFRFDVDRDDYEIVNLRPNRIMVDKDATNELNAKFIVEFKEDTMEDLITMFPTKKKALIEVYGEKMGTDIKYVEYWTNELVVWKVGDILLGKKKNPNWNWDEKDRKENLKKLKKQWTSKVKNDKLNNLLLNHFNEPRKPYVILSLKNLGKDIYGDTSDFEQGKVIQDIVNRRKRQIDQATVRARGREVISGSAMTKEEAKKLISNPNSPIWLKSGKASDAVTHIAPQQISPIVLTDLQESKQALDNVMGVHGTTRGEKGTQETAKGRTILREGDFGRIDLLVRRIDKKTELAYAWMMQMSKVWLTDEHFIKMLGKEGAVEYLKFSSDNIEDGQEVMIKSELTVDKATERQNADKRLEVGLIDPLTYFEKQDETKPKESARRLAIYNIDPKLYVQMFLVDANTEGAENTSEGRAMKENESMEQGDVVPPFENADKLHVDTHGKRMKQTDFNELDDVIKKNFVTHVQGEVEILKRDKQI